MYARLFPIRWMLTFTVSPGHSLGLLSEGNLFRGRRAVNSLVPAGSYDDDLPQPSSPLEKPSKPPIDVPVPEPFDVPVRSPGDVPVRDPRDVPFPPAEPPFPRAPQPATPPERKPEAWLDAWLSEQRQKRAGERSNPANHKRRKSDR
jgi:hypothetical protein